MPSRPTSPSSDNDKERRVLVVAPTGRDAALLCTALARDDIQAEECATCELACREMANGVGCLMVAEEALTPADIQRFADLIAHQPPWSDFPLILLTLSGEVTPQSQRRRLLRAPLEGALELERPIRPESLISTVNNALRGRLRQYEVRDSFERQRQAEEALRRSEKLAVAGRLAASIAHEINNPLEAAINLVYLARTADSREAARDFLLQSEAELARVSAIATETLKFYRQPNRPTQVHLADIVNSTLLLYGHKITAADVHVQTDLRDSGPIVGYSGELRQMFSNLLTNAIDAASGARVRVRVRQAVDRAGNPGVKLVVADTGSGIPESVKATIFEPFVSTKGQRGTGLGLWVTLEIVQKHGGSIRVKSCTDPRRHGTVFSVFLPITPPATAPAENLNAPELSHATAGDV